MAEILREQDAEHLQEDFGQLVRIYEAAFPPEERYPVEALLSMSQTSGVELIAYYDGALMCGFSLSVVADSFVYLLFLAVDGSAQSKGYGSRIIDQVRKRHPGLTVVLAIEPVDEPSENQDQRLRRLAFYKRNGFDFSGYDLIEEGVRYSLLVDSPGFDPQVFYEDVTRMANGMPPIEVRPARS